MVPLSNREGTGSPGNSQLKVNRVDDLGGLRTDEAIAEICRSHICVTKGERLVSQLRSKSVTADQEILTFNFHGKLNVQDFVLRAFVGLFRLTKFHTFRRKVVGRVERFDVHSTVGVGTSLADFLPGGLCPHPACGRGYWLTTQRSCQYNKKIQKK